MDALPLLSPESQINSFALSSSVDTRQIISRTTFFTFYITFLTFPPLLVNIGLRLSARCSLHILTHSAFSYTTILSNNVGRFSTDGS